MECGVEWVNEQRDHRKKHGILNVFTTLEISKTHPHPHTHTRPSSVDTNAMCWTWTTIWNINVCVCVCATWTFIAEKKVALNFESYSLAYIYRSSLFRCCFFMLIMCKHDLDFWRHNNLSSTTQGDSVPYLSFFTTFNWMTPYFFWDDVSILSTHWIFIKINPKYHNYVGFSFVMTSQLFYAASFFSLNFKRKSLAFQ